MCLYVCLCVGYKGINLQRENAHFAFWRGQQWYYSKNLNIVEFHAFLKVIIIALRFLPDGQTRDYELSVELLHYNLDFLFCSYDEIENTLWVKLARCSVSYRYRPESAAAVQPTRIPCFILITLTLNKKYTRFFYIDVVEYFKLHRWYTSLSLNILFIIDPNQSYQWLTVKILILKPKYDGFIAWNSTTDE